jgi:hypothetical protein
MSDQPVLNLFPIDHPFRTWHAALRTREQMTSVLVSRMYGDYNKMNALEVQTSLVSLKSLFDECQDLVTRMCSALNQKLNEQMANEQQIREELERMRGRDQ